MEINKEKLNRKRGWMDKKNGENLPHSKLKNPNPHIFHVIHALIAR
jgi:hypothetical protein